MWRCDNLAPMGADLPPTAEGELSRTPLAHLLVYALDRRLTGVLFFRETSGVEHVVRLARGAPVKTRPGDRFALLGEMLVEAGAVSAATIEEAVATKGLLGDVLMLTGRVDRNTLERVAEQQFVRRVVRLFSLPKETTYRYYEGHCELIDYGGEPACVDPLSLLWAGVRAHGDASTMMEASLGVLGDAAIRLHPRATTVRLELSDAEQRVIDDLFRAPMPMSRLSATGHLPEETLRRLCYTLLITRQIDVGTGTLPVGAGDRPNTGSGGGAVVAKMRLKAEAHRVGAAAPDPPGDGERNTASGLRKADLRAVLLAEAAARATPVEDPQATLKSAPDEQGEGDADPQAQRAAQPPDVHVEVHAEGSAEAVSVRARGRTSQAPSSQVTVLSASTHFQLANARLSERDLAGALEACSTARKAAPGEPDYIALSVWIRLQMPGADLKALAVELDEVLAVHEAHVDARYYRAVLRRRLSDDAGAIRDLRRVIELFPAHSDAARELAAIEARRPKERGGILGRLFKR